jgi:hypothetical protein
MCLAIYKPAGKRIEKNSLRSGFYGNNSGSGFAYVADGKLVVVKGLMSFKEFYEQYHALELNHAMMVHFRAATHGPVNDANCHPFTMCDGQFAMVHNGIFRIPMSNKALSDTGNYCEQVLEPAIKDGTYKDVAKMQTNDVWGWGAYILMSAAGEVLIYNDKMGAFDDDVWYSNQGYKYGSAFGRADKTYLDLMDEKERPKSRQPYFYGCNED